MVERTAPMSRGWQQAVSLVGLLTALMGLPLIPGHLCATVYLAAEGDADAGEIALGIFTLALLLLTVGAGSTAFWHGTRALGLVGRLRVEPRLGAGLGLVHGLGGAVHLVGLGGALRFQGRALGLRRLDPLGELPGGDLAALEEGDHLLLGLVDVLDQLSAREQVDPDLCQLPIVLGVRLLQLHQGGAQCLDALADGVGIAALLGEGLID